MKTIVISLSLLLIPLLAFSMSNDYEYEQDKKHQDKEYKCNQKSRCSEMNSCKEAYFYLEKCGLSRLDRDKDGIPCEKLCGN